MSGININLNTTEHDCHCILITMSSNLTEIMLFNRVGPLDPNENSGINASKSLDLQPFHLKDSQRRGQITSSHEQNGQVASIISIEPPQEDTVISSINHDTSFNIQQELVPVHTNPALNWLRSMLQQSISCCRPRYINNEDHVTCLKVYCTSIDPSHCYSVVQVTRSTTVQEVVFTCYTGTKISFSFGEFLTLLFLIARSYLKSLHVMYKGIATCCLHIA